MWPLRVGRPTVVTRVECVNGVDINAREFGGECEVELGTNVSQYKLCFVHDVRQGHVVFLRILHDIDQCEQPRNIAARLPGQAQAEKIVRLVGGTIATHGLAHIAFARVVRCNGIEPVALIEFLQILQVVECRSRRIDDVAAAVVPPVLLDAESFRGARNHLPKTRGPTV